MSDYWRPLVTASLLVSAPDTPVQNVPLHIMLLCLAAEALASFADEYDPEEISHTRICDSKFVQGSIHFFLADFQSRLLITLTVLERKQMHPPCA